MIPGLYFTTWPRILMVLSFRLPFLAQTSATVWASAPVAGSTLLMTVLGTTGAPAGAWGVPPGIPGAAMGGGMGAGGAAAAPPAGARVPKKTSAKVRFRVLDSKLFMTIGLATVTSVPFSILASGTAAQTSPRAVWMRR